MKLNIIGLSYISETGENILNDISLELNPKEIISIQGITVGKSLFIKILLGLIEYKTGDVQYDGKSLKKMGRIEINDLRKKIGYVPQVSSLFPNLTIFENIALPLEYHLHLTTSEISEKVFTWLDKINLRKHSNERPYFFSNSKIRLVDLVRALVLDPIVLFIDDPIQDISESDFEIFEKLIIEKAENNTSILLTCDPLSRMPNYKFRKDFNLVNGNLVPIS